MEKFIKKRSGFTLIEVVVGLAIFAIITVTLVSIMTLFFKVNYTNKDSYTADTYSKAFFEALRNDSSRPSKKTANFTGQYYMLFDDVDEVTNYGINNFKTLPTSTLSADPNTNLTSAIEEVNNNAIALGTDKKIGFIVKINWNNDEDKKIYEIETWTWVRDKGESSLINRKTLLAGV